MMIASGERHGVLIDGKRDLYVWGSNGSGQLGTGTIAESLIPIKLGDKKWDKVACGSFHTVAIDDIGDLYAWGSNASGQLGDGTTTSINIPTKIGDKKWSKIACGTSHTMAIDDIGDLYAWGSNASGQLGDGTTSNILVPTKIGDKKWSSITGGNNHSMAIDDIGDLYAWGNNSSYQLGDGTTTARRTPVKIGNLKWMSIEAGDSSSVGILENGDMYGWGNYRTAGQDTTSNTTTPTKIGDSKWRSVSLNYRNAIAISADGLLYVWGVVDYGATGIGQASRVPVNTQIGNNNALYCYGGYYNGFVIMSNLEVYSWGKGDFGQIGDGNKVGKNYPVLILNIGNKKYSIRQDNTLYVYSNGSWTTIEDVQSGMVDISILDRVDGYSPLDEIQGYYEIVMWTDNEYSTGVDAKLSGQQVPKTIEPVTFQTYQEGASVIIDGTSSNRYLFTSDANEYYRWSGDDFELVNIEDIQSLGNTSDEISDISPEELSNNWHNNNISFAIYLTDKLNYLSFSEFTPTSTTTLSDASFYILNTTAKIDIGLKVLTINGNVSDDDLTRVQYKVLLNNQPYFPLDGTFTPLENSPIAIDISMDTSEVNIGQENTVRVEFQDFFGTTDYWEATFIGDYPAVIFYDENGEPYSDHDGNTIKELEFGQFVISEYSDEKNIILKNETGFPITNIEIYSNSDFLNEYLILQYKDSSTQEWEGVYFKQGVLQHEDSLNIAMRLKSDLGGQALGVKKMDINVYAEKFKQ